MQLDGATLTIADNSHAKDSDRFTEVLDVKLSGKCRLEGSCPVGVAVEDQHVIDINNNVGYDVGCKKRLADAVTLQLE